MEYRHREVTSYELMLTKDALSVENEPVDAADFKEFEIDDMDNLSSSMRDVRGIGAPKRYFAIVGPELGNLERLGEVQL